MASQDDRVFQVNNYALIELEKVTLRNINGAEKKAELVLRLKKEKTLEIVTSRKACLNIYNAINRVLM